MNVSKLAVAVAVTGGGENPIMESLSSRKINEEKVIKKVENSVNLFLVINKSIPVIWSYYQLSNFIKNK